MENHGFPGAVDRFSVPGYYAGKRVIDDIGANSFIAQSIAGDGCFMAARFGAVELNYIYYYLKAQMGQPDAGQRKEALRMICFNAGFFPKDESEGDKLAELYLDAMKDMDLCGAWSVYMEDYILQKYAPDSEITKLRFLEPWFTKSGQPWSRALKGMKVLVIHPFTDTMEKQYQKRTEIFANKFGEDDILPEMELKFLKAVQSIGGEGAEGFTSWFDAYEYMLNSIKSTDFDVAILGCGAYGFPLAAEIKRMGKKAIHIGGATQLMFGIKGKRWDDDPDINALYNGAWVSPDAAEKPRHADGVEGGCYW